MTDRRPTLTDREAIRRLAEIADALAIESRDTTIMQEAGQLIRDLSEPAAPTVTREQAEEVELVIRSFFKSQSREVPCLGCMPGFFRAVADQLERQTK